MPELGGRYPTHSRYEDPASADPPFNDFITSNALTPNVNPGFNNGHHNFSWVGGATEPITTIHGGTFISGNLAHNIPHLKGPISKIVEDASYLVAKPVDVQLQKLVMDPCGSLDPSQPPIIIIDGLDECEGHAAQRELLRSIANAVRKHPPIPDR
ncbi:hypothetical protein C8J57DRAFT_1241997 [Mycena rebaudengoi]|nr:hypothetical protein C8J57DRAFT_1241997 [Mycena rebaudengoi]